VAPLTSPDPIGRTSSLSRRHLLELIGAALAVPALAACAGDAPAASVDSDPSASPTPGGTARLAFAGAGAGESLDPTAGSTAVEMACYSILYDQIFFFAGGTAQPGLATAATLSADARTVTLTLRDGVTWHDGSTFTAKDVVHTFVHRASPKRAYPSELTMYLDLAKARATGELEVTLPVVQPVGDPATLIAGSGIFVIRDGAEQFAVGSALGTGPYKIAAWEAGSQARLTRNDAYWDGAGAADEVVLLSISDPAARVNAVRGNQCDYASDISWATAKAGVPDADLQIRDGGPTLRTSYGFVLNVQRPLCADAKVRKAIRLGVNRQALVDAVFLGYGEPGNDLFGFGAKYFLDSAPVPTHDPEQARTLLTEAGAQGKELVIRTAEYETGLNSSAELFAEQMRAIGLTPKLVSVGVQEGFDPDGMTATDAIAFPLGPFSLDVTYTRSAAYPTLAFNDPELVEQLAIAVGSPQESARSAAWTKVQQVMVDRGNWVAWGRGDVLSLARRNLVGIAARESPKYPWLGKVGFS